ncbi:MAG: sulfatase-like hydrolase/transferase [Planctomycetota bacterium]|jgi:arylsulfatase A-like enzyme
MSLTKHLTLGIAAGLAAGALIGLIETLSLVLIKEHLGDLDALAYAIVAYGLFGLLIGLALAAFVWFLNQAVLNRSRRWTDRQWYLLYLAILFVPIVLIIIRYRLIRDLFQEKLVTFSRQGLLVHGLLMAGGVLGFGLIVGGGWRLARSQRLSFLSRPIGGLGLNLILLTAALTILLFSIPPSATGQAISQSIPSHVTTAPNIILIMVDTLRADHLSAYGYHKATPNMDGLAADGVLYQTAIAQASWTKPSVATILTSLYPSSHQAISKTDRLPEVVTTLPEILQANGYVTGGIGNNAHVTTTFNFDQGFTHFEYLAPDYLFWASENSSQLAIFNILRLIHQRFLANQTFVQHFYQPAPVVNHRGLAWLETHKQERFLLFLHYMDPHDPYMVHPFNGTGYARVHEPNPLPDVASLYSDVYDGEVAYLDQHLGEFFSWLKAENLYNETMIILTADHGEEFFEHGGWWHGSTLYEEQIHVPLIIKFPGGLRAGSVDDHLARSLDIAPTILDIVGLEIPAAMQGVSLLIDEEVSRPSQVFSEEDFEGNVLQSMRGLDWKYIQASPDNRRSLPPTQLFQLEADPNEQDNLINTEPGQARRFAEQLESIQRYAVGQAVEREETNLDKLTEERLRNLGY